MSQDLYDWYRSIGPAEAEELKLDFSVALERAMLNQGINKADLAKKAGVSAARITKALRGDSNLTIESMVKLAQSVGHTVHVHLARKDAQVRWIEVHTSARNRLTSINRHQYARSQPIHGTSSSEELLAL